MDSQQQDSVYVNTLTLLNERHGLVHLQDTFDTYKCRDCGVTLTGYKRGDPNFNTHIVEGDGRCRYVRAKFHNRESELRTICGQLRFKKGLVAVPTLTDARHGYILINGTEYCLICLQQPYQGHHMGCSQMACNLKIYLKEKVLFYHYYDDVLMFHPQDDNTYETDTFGDPEVDSTSCTKFLPCNSQDFSVLGESANMYHVLGTVDTHACKSCKLELNNFRTNDTLLGEHIYHTYSKGLSCPYLEKRYNGQKEKLELILGKERFRRGYFAFPNASTHSVKGYIQVDGLKRCIVCASDIHKWHNGNCTSMYKNLCKKLKWKTILL